MKEFKTIAAQIGILESRGMIVDEGASTVLLRENYYSIINGYKDPFLDKGAMRANANDLYLEGPGSNGFTACFNLTESSVRFLSAICSKRRRH